MLLPRLAFARVLAVRSCGAGPIKVFVDGGWVLVLPDADRPLFHVFAESVSNDQAQALAEKYARVVSGLQAIKV